jgi:hypothetical protein
LILEGHWNVQGGVTGCPQWVTQSCEVERRQSDLDIHEVGDGEVAAETDSLLRLGRICDAHAIAADTLVRALIDGGHERSSSEV